jgi:hypothetical protein
MKWRGFKPNEPQQAEPSREWRKENWPKARSASRLEQVALRVKKMAGTF